MDDEELQQESTWDFDRSESRPAVRGARAVVSVSFGRDDFNRVVECAGNADMKTSEFIRKAALEKCDGVTMLRSTAGISSFLGWMIFAGETFPSETRGGWARQLVGEPGLQEATA